jgi:predicted nucleic acid-binding Zn ribbon protein
MEHLTEFTCIRCQKPIPLARFLKKSYTCSDPCATAIRKEQSRLDHARACRLCHRPATPEQIRDWQAWAKAKGLVLKVGRPRKQATVEELAAKPLAEVAPPVQSGTTVQKRNQSQSRKEV